MAKGSDAWGIKRVHAHFGVFRSVDAPQIFKRKSVLNHLVSPTACAAKKQSSSAVTTPLVCDKYLPPSFVQKR